MEEWERRVAPGRVEEPFPGLRMTGANAAVEERELSWMAGDGLPVLNP